MPQPQQVEVVVIGGGIAGCSCAYFLARAGCRVALCEKGEIGAEQSSRNWGFVRKQGRAPAELPLMMHSLDIWRSLETELQASFGFFQGGTLYLSDNEQRYAAHQAWLEQAGCYRLDSRFLRRQELEQLLPAIRRQRYEVLYTPSDACAEPDQVMAALAAGCRRQGVQVLTQCAVRGVDVEAGRVAGVVTEHGRIRAAQVVVAGGAWSSYFLRHLGIVLPQLKVIGSVMATVPAANLLQQNIWGRALGLRRRRDGGYNVAFGGQSNADLTPDYLRFLGRFLPTLRASKETVSLTFGRRFWQELMWPQRWNFDRPTPFEAIRTLNPPPDLKLLARAHQHLGEVFPALRGLKIARSWAGMIDVTPDELPVIDRVEQLPGLFVSTGYSGHGFGIGPGAGKVVSELVSGQTPAVDLSAFRLSRLL